MATPKKTAPAAKATRQPAPRPKAKSRSATQSVPDPVPAQHTAPEPAAPMASVAPTRAFGPPIVVAKGLGKSFKDLRAVDGVDLEVRQGEVFAFLGPNGAGKSTTIKMFCTLLRPTTGTAGVAGHDSARQPRAVRRAIGLVFQERTLDDQLTAEENLRFHAVLYGVPRAEVEPRIARVMGIVDLADRRKDLVSTYSGGMARRLEVARALLHAPKVLFLDEPTIGLDPQTRARLWKDVLRLRDEEGVTVFMTTHYMDEAEYADRIAIIDHGKIVAVGSPTDLKAKIGLDTIRIATADDAKALALLQKAGFTAKAGEGHVVVTARNGEEAVAAVIGAVKMPVRSVSVHRPTLDDVFMHFTGHEIRGGGPDGPTGMARAFMAARGRR